MEVKLLGHIIQEPVEKELPPGVLCVVDSPFDGTRELRLRVKQRIDGEDRDNVYGFTSKGVWVYVADGVHRYANARVVDQLDVREGNLL